MGSQPDYNATIHTLAKVCLALDVNFGELLEITPELPKKRRPTPKGQ
jgi:DNA-binding Xre family transcriptional regulator